MKKIISSLWPLVVILIFPFLVSCGSRAVKTAPTAEGQFIIAKKDFDKKHYLSAIEGFQKVIFNFPGTTVVDTAQYYLGLSYYENEDYEVAGVEFSRLISNYPRSAYVDDAQYMAGVCFYKNTPKHYGLDQEDLRKAIVAMEDFLVDNPDSPLAEDARRVILEAKTRLAKKEFESAMLYFKLSEYKAAEIYFQLVVDDYTDTEFGAAALFKLAEIAYKTGNSTGALEKLNHFMTLYPENKLISRAKELSGKISATLGAANVSGDAK